MIVKIIGNRGGGSAKSVLNYLMDKPDGQAEVLQGDPELSREIAESLTFKNKYTVGVLSFAEKPSEISNTQKREIMEKFESVIFAGLHKEQYNITWIQHTDKNRLELNFFIPNVEMQSGKRLQPYYDKADRHLVDNFKKMVNYEYKLSDPDDPTKRQELILDKSTPKTKQELSRAVSDYIYTLISNGKINDRNDVLRALEEQGIEIARITNKNISIKNPDGGQNIRLKGAFYEQTFRAEKHIGSGYEIRKAEYETNRTASYERAKQQLDLGMSKREQQFQQKYGDRTAEIALTHKNDIQDKQILDTARDNNLTGNSIDSVGDIQLSNSERIPRNGEVEKISRDLQSGEQRNFVWSMQDKSGREDLREDRSKFQGHLLEQGDIRSNSNTTNENNNQDGELNDRSGRTFFDNLKEFGQDLLGRASDFIDAVKEFGNRLFGTESELRANSDIANQIEQRTSENERAISANEPTLQRNEMKIENAKLKDFDLTL